jgi:hypothetical protein
MSSRTPERKESCSPEGSDWHSTCSTRRLARSNCGSLSNAASKARRTCCWCSIMLAFRESDASGDMTRCTISPLFELGRDGTLTLSQESAVLIGECIQALGRQRPLQSSACAHADGRQGRRRGVGGGGIGCSEFALRGPCVMFVLCCAWVLRWRSSPMRPSRRLCPRACFGQDDALAVSDPSLDVENGEVVASEPFETAVVERPVSRKSDLLRQRQQLGGGIGEASPRASPRPVGGRQVCAGVLNVIRNLAGSRCSSTLPSTRACQPARLLTCPPTGLPTT